MKEFRLLPTHPLLKRVHQLQSWPSNTRTDSEEILKEFSDLYEGFNQVKSFQARIKICNRAIPVIFHTRPVSFAWKLQFDRELDWLMANNILEPVGYKAQNSHLDHHQWCYKRGPMVIYVYAVTIVVNDYPLLIIEEANWHHTRIQPYWLERCVQSDQNRTGVPEILHYFNSLRLFKI